MAIVYARVNPKKNVKQFYRCLIKFDQDWQKVDADDATINRLRQEQMLEVVDDAPVGFVDESSPVETASIPSGVSADVPADAAPVKKATK